MYYLINSPQNYLWVENIMTVDKTDSQEGDGIFTLVDMKLMVECFSLFSFSILSYPSLLTKIHMKS